MNLKEASHFFSIPKKLILHLYKKGFLHNPLKEDEISNLSFFRYVWRDQLVLQTALARFSKQRREKIVREIGLTKPESYVLNRYLNSNEKLFMKQVVQELHHYYKVPKGVAVKIVRKMRKKAYRIRKKEKAQNLGSSENGGNSTP